MRRVGAAGVLAGLMLAGLATSAAEGRPGPALLYRAPARSPLLAGSRMFRATPLLVSGTDGYRRGEYLYQDYLFDDYGADTTPGLGASGTWGSQPLFAPAAGDLQYPAGDPYRNDAADLVEFRIRPMRHAIAYRVTLNTATSRNAAVVGIGIDTDNDGGPQVAWPRGAGVTSPGLDEFITAWGTGGEVSRLPGGRAKRLPRGAVHMDLARNQMTIVVPRSLMNPRGRTWRYVAGTGLWSGHGWTSISPGAPAVFNLAFRFHEPVGSVHNTGAGLPGYTTEPGTGSWFEDGQARELAGGTTGNDYAVVSFRGLARRTPADLHRPGRTQSRIYPSSVPGREGVDHDTFPEFGGSLQPYLVTLPPGYRRGRRAPLTFALHPSNSGYQTFHVFMPNWSAELGAQRSSVVVTPLSRGLNGPDPASGQFTGAAEADFFEVWRDVRRRFSIDPTRVVLSGYSLGAYDSYHLAELMPDLFSSIFSVVGTAPTNGRDTELLGNLRWVPVLAWNLADDVEVPYTDWSATAAQMKALRLRHEQWTFPAGNHLALAMRDDWEPAVPRVGLRQVERDPQRIDFGYYPSLDAPRYGLVHDHAYWVSSIRLARRAQPSGELARADVSARSLAFGRTDPGASDYTASGSAGGLPAAIQGTSWGGAVPSPASNALDLTLRNVRSLIVDGVRARLSGRRRLTVRTHSDGFASIVIVLAHRRVTIAVPAGDRVTPIEPAGSR